ncbi:MAG: peptidase M10A and M12B matrixin and adamalysin [Parcubacteria group bacterium Gr01-1014_46]|nr:MAG: peptidase M10A and M12B matrixin and adamalysin [Parcubacteria group bacterium Gr01-1014_46]
MNKIFNIVFLVAVVVFGYFYRDQIQNIWSQSLTRYFPCRTPISYSIGSFDKKFGVSEKDFLGALEDAEDIWEKTINKDLFKHVAEGSLKVNLIYDVRQDTTLQLKNMGVVVENTRGSYDSMKLRYDSLIAQYNEEKRIFESRLADFEVRKRAYDVEVTAVNKRGGANKETFNRLNTEKNYLNQEIIYINQLQANLNQKAENINALTTTLNQLATNLNLNVKKFNTIGSSLGGEFEEGTYSSDVNGQRIDIYQFENRSKLVRVLAHELGHALGLEHLEDSKAIMYRLNNGYNEKATASDILQLKNLCGI